MFVIHVFWHQFTYLNTQPPQGVHVHLCICSLFTAKLALGDEGMGVQLVYSGQLLLVWDVLFHMRNNGSFVGIFVIFWWMGESMWVYVCVYAHTRTHCTCTHTRTACEPRTRHLEGPKNPDGLNLGIYVIRAKEFPAKLDYFLLWSNKSNINQIFVYVYKVHMCLD